jgi:hypothetical protein
MKHLIIFSLPYPFFGQCENFFLIFPQQWLMCYFASVLSVVTIQNACLSERGVFFRGSHPTNIMFHFEKSGIICSLSEKKKYI